MKIKNVKKEDKLNRMSDPGQTSRSQLILIREL